MILPAAGAVAWHKQIASRVSVNEAGCWVWPGAQARGYGSVTWGGRKHRAHRVAYTVLVGPIPDGLQIDHLCRNKLCLNPDHMEVVTNAENQRRALPTHCRQGHPYDEENIYWTPQYRPEWRRHRRCRACILEYGRERWRATKQRRGAA